MANVRLIEDYGNHKAGEVVNLPASVARSLIYNNKALDGKAVLKAYSPGKEVKTEKRETIQPDNAYPKKISDNGFYQLSNGEKVRGKSKAIKAQNKLD